MIILESLIFLIAVASALSECPPPEVVSPCQCQTKANGNEIHCNNIAIGTVQKSLKMISSQVRRKDFYFLHIAVDNKTKSTEIPANFTDILTFGIIDIDIDNKFCNFSTLPPLRVHESAFAGTKDRLNFLALACFNVSIGPKPYNIFDSINSFTNIKTLYLGGVAKIPTAAFKSLNRLTELRIVGPLKPHIYPLDNINQSIGVDAIYQLDNLEILYLAVDYLPAKALRMKPSTRMLKMDLVSPNINGSSFAVESLNQFNRPTKLEIVAQKLKFLQANVFQPFLDANIKNQLKMDDQIPLNCSDCRNAWLAKQQDKYKAKVLDAYCDGDRNGPKVFDKKFEQCK